MNRGMNKQQSETMILVKVWKSPELSLGMLNGYRVCETAMSMGIPSCIPTDASDVGPGTRLQLSRQTEAPESTFRRAQTLNNNIG